MTDICWSLWDKKGEKEDRKLVSNSSEAIIEKQFQGEQTKSAAIRGYKEKTNHQNSLRKYHQT